MSLTVTMVEPFAGFAEVPAAFAPGSVSGKALFKRDVILGLVPRIQPRLMWWVVRSSGQAHCCPV
ncbi:hypothetical protein AGR6A_Lc50103 [Agrobacterium sp. NCPPB 925]|nr:hypothetical protein AGR6A_Lc50103 [Agrobacterium sp. NCPPB 925]